MIPLEAESFIWLVTEFKEVRSMQRSQFTLAGLMKGGLTRTNADSL